MVLIESAPISTVSEQL